MFDCGMVIACHKQLLIRLRWTSTHKQHPPPSDSQCNQCNQRLSAFVLSKLDYCNSLLCGSPHSIHSGQASKSTKFCSKISHEILQVWSFTASFEQSSLVTSPLKDWLQDFNPVLQHFHQVFSCLYRPASIRLHPFQTPPFIFGHKHPPYSFCQN